MDKNDIHKELASSSNNDSWGFVENKNPTEEESIEAIHMVHASCWHWSKVGEPINIVRGHYMVAKVYFGAGRLNEAIYWAEKCWDKTEVQKLEGWDKVFGIEIAARAQAAAGNKNEFNEFNKKYNEAVVALSKEDKEICEGEWNRGPWFGFK